MMSYFKRPVDSGPDLRPHKRARTFPVTQDESCSATSLMGAGWCKMCSHCKPRAIPPRFDSLQKHERADSKSENPVASPVGEAVRVGTSKRHAQQDDQRREDYCTKENLECSHSKHEGDKIGSPAPATQKLKDGTTPQASSLPDSSLIAHSKTTSSTRTELSCHGPDASVLVDNDPNSHNCPHCRQYWPSKPRPQPFRPDIPYRKGLSVTIYKHEACPPFGVDYDIEPDTRKPAQDCQHKSLVDLCLEHPPTEGKTDYEDTRTLQIMEELHVKAGRGAQLVVCRLNNDDQDYVAKIYDPLYYDPKSTYCQDVTWHSDMMYSREAAAYNEMDKFNVGFEAPKFHGSWTFQVPLSLPTGKKMRDVRMILIERIHGNSMVEFDKTSISESGRLKTLKIIAQIIELISWHGVRHEYTGPWSVMLCDSETAGEVGRIVIVGFSESVVTTLDNTYVRYGTPEPWPDKPANPLDRWWRGEGGRKNCFYEHFWEWLPESWDSRMRPLQEWMYNTWGKNDLFALPFRELIYEDEEERWYRNGYYLAST